MPRGCQEPNSAKNSTFYRIKTEETTGQRTWMESNTVRICSAGLHLSTGDNPVGAGQHSTTGESVATPGKRKTYP